MQAGLFKFINILFMLMVFAPSNTYFPTSAFPSLVLGLSISLSLFLSFSNVFVDPQKLLDFIFETKNDLILPLRYFICIHSHQSRFHKVMHKTSSSDALIARWVSLMSCSGVGPYKTTSNFSKILLAWFMHPAIIIFA